MAKDKEKKRNSAGIGTDAAANDEIKAETAGKTAETAGETAGTREKTAETKEKDAEAAKLCPETEEGGLFLTKEELKQAQEKIAELRKKADEAIADAQRIQAEFSNFRRRNASIRSESTDDGIRETITNLLPVLDNFERALANSDDTPFAKGIVQIHKQLTDVLAKCGLERVKDDGMFDPEMHEAVLRDEEGDAESGKITAVLQTGYSVKGKIIRHTLVKVKV